MAKHLVCVVIDAGPAAYMKPVFEQWTKDPPPFEWSIRLAEKAAATLGNVTGLDDHRRADVERNDSAVEFIGDAMLVSAGGWPVEKAHVSAGRASGVPTIQFVDTCYNYAWRFCKDGRWTLPERLLLVTAESVSEAVKEGVPGDICTVVGHPAWERISVMPPSHANDVLFVGAPVEKNYGTSLGYTEIDAWEMLKDVTDHDVRLKGKLFYAMHPEQDAASLPSDIDLVDYQASALTRFDTLVGMFSAPLVDAYLAGRRSISLQPDATETDMFFLSRQGYLSRITDRKALACSLSATSLDPTAFACQVRGSSERLDHILRELLAA